MASTQRLQGLTIKAALVLGFSLTLGVWVFTGYYFTRRMAGVESEAAIVSARYMRAQELLSNVSAQVLLNSVYLRDALLDQNPAETSKQRLRLEHAYDTLDSELDKYVPVMGSPAEREQIARLRQEIAAFRSTTRDVLEDFARTPIEARALLNQRVVPRRESVIRLSEDVRALNRAAFVDQQRAIAELHRNANQRSWQWLGVALALSVGIGLFAIIYSTKLEARLRRQQAVDAQNTRSLQELSAKLITAQEEERQHIARELHDEIGQVLTAIKVELAVAERRIELSGGHAELLDQVQTIADGALQSVRNLSHLLRPSLLDDVGLPAAVDWYLRTFAKRFAISTSLAQKDMSDRLGPEVELAAYRIVQEALTNVARHAMARSCSVMLQRTADSLRVAIEDNGCGFDPAITELSGRRGLGLLGMRERAAQLKGTMRVVSALGEGTRIEVDLPVSAALTLHDELVAAPVHG